MRFSLSARPVALTWAALMVLLVVEIVIAHSGTFGFAAPAVGVAMACVVAMTFMRLPSAPSTAIAFAVAGVFWLCIMMGLGSLDPATRRDVPVGARTGSF